MCQIRRDPPKGEGIPAVNRIDPPPVRRIRMHRVANRHASLLEQLMRFPDDAYMHCIVFDHFEDASYVSRI